MARKSVKKRLKKKIRITWTKTSLINSFYFEKFLKSLMKKGKLELTFKTFLQSTSLLKNSTTTPFFLFFEAFLEARPGVKISSIRKGELWYKIPEDQQDHRARQLGIKWVVMAINDKNLNSKTKKYQKINEELLKFLLEKKGTASKRLEMLQGLALKGRANTHFRWRRYWL